MSVIKTIASDSNNLYETTDLAISVISQMQVNGSVVISTNNEGYSATEYKLYDLLDKICAEFAFDKTKITIETTNKFESHSEYNIVIVPFPWPKVTVNKFLRSGLTKEDYLGKKTFKNTFATFNNRPTWYRLCLANHISKLPVSSIVTCNTSWDELSQNFIPFQSLAREAQTEFYDIVEFIKTCPRPSPVGYIGDKDQFATTVGELFGVYNDLLIDVIGITFATGDTFYIDEKETRPMLCCTPFITYGPTGCLETLRGNGFKTFGDYWDESYDQYCGYERIEKMYATIDKISKIPEEQLRKMYNDMLPILNHNFNRIVEFVNEQK